MALAKRSKRTSTSAISESGQSPSLMLARRGVTLMKDDSMRLKFYGTRGSIPVCDEGFQQFGGNTTCFQITFTDTNRIAIIDAGTGLRNLGRDLRAIGHYQDELVIGFTHFHWDHIQGFPFFAPAYNPEQKITILTLGRNQTIGDLREIFEVPLQSQYFPVQLDRMGACALRDNSARAREASGLARALRVAPPAG